MSILSCQNLTYRYSSSAPPVFSHLSYAFETGKVYAIVGRSGAGKTTLLSLLSGLMKPTEGEILFHDQSILKSSPYVYRSQKVGVVFQSFNLLPKLTALENVRLSMDVSQKQIDDPEGEALTLLEKMGLTQEETRRRILKLSGGQQQRVAIARALSFHPSVLLADEPTGNLDETTQQAILDIFTRLAKEEGKCVILVTHAPKVAEAADAIFDLPVQKAPPAPAAS